MSECKISMRYFERTDISLMFGFIRFLKNNKFVFRFKARVLQDWLQIQSLTDSPTIMKLHIFISQIIKIATKTDLQLLEKPMMSQYLPKIKATQQLLIHKLFGFDENLF